MTAESMISSVIFSAPRSSKRSARNTEASSTALLILGSLAPLRTQLVGNQCPRWNEVSYISLCAPYPAPNCRNAQFVVFHTKNNRVSYCNSERLTHGRWNHNPALFADLATSLEFHVSSSLLSGTILSECHLNCKSGGIEDNLIHA